MSTEATNGAVVPETKMIGIRIPRNSDLDDRLYQLRRRLKLPYHILLERWITAEERGVWPEPLPIEPVDSNPAPESVSSGDLADLRARVEKLEGEITIPDHVYASEWEMRDLYNALSARVEKIESQLTATVPTVRPVKAPRADQRDETIARITEMSAAGLSLRKIADQLNTDGVPTFSGVGTWQSGTIAKIMRHK